MLRFMEKERTQNPAEKDQRSVNSQMSGKTGTKKTSITGTTEKKADRLITKLLQGGLALAMSALFSGIFTGYFEAMTGMDIEMGSSEFYFTSVPYALIAFYLFMKLFGYFNLFESKKFVEV